jgi:hypothetical protein
MSCPPSADSEQVQQHSSAESGKVLQNLPSDVAAFYRDFFDDGAVLLLIRVNPPRRKKIAIDLLKHDGGESVRSTFSRGEPQ